MIEPGDIVLYQTNMGKNYHLRNPRHVGVVLSTNTSSNPVTCEVKYAVAGKLYAGGDPVNTHEGYLIRIGHADLHTGEITL